MTYEKRELLLDIQNVSLTFGDHVILRNVNAQIRNIVRHDKATQGQIVGLLAPSGMGKTMLFNIISGLLKPDPGGRVLIGPDQHPTEIGLVGVLQQKYPLFNHRTVHGNLAVAAGRGMPKASKKEREEKIDFYLNKFGLLDKKDKYPVQLSGGQRQRIAIAQQLLCSENFLLFDEPFSGLDVLAIKKVTDLMVEVSNLNENNTLIVVSHDVSSTCAISDHVWLMGREDGPDGTKIPGAKILKEFNLIDEGLAWRPDVQQDHKFLEYVKDIKSYFSLL